jgi:hypothetical protein
MAMEQERRKAVTLAACVACMGAPCAIFAQRFPHLVWGYIGLMLLMLGLAAAQFAKLKRGRDE